MVKVVVVICRSCCCYCWSCCTTTTTVTVTTTTTTATTTRCSATKKSTVPPSCWVGVPYDISWHKICWRLINHHFGHESYPSRQTNAKHQVMACTVSKLYLGEYEYPVNIAISDIPLETRFFGLHFSQRMYQCINHFYVIGSKSYWIQQNNAKYTGITPFKVIQGHRLRYQSKAHTQSPISV